MSTSTPCRCTRRVLGANRSFSVTQQLAASRRGRSSEQRSVAATDPAFSREGSCALRPRRDGQLSTSRSSLKIGVAVAVVVAVAAAVIVAVVRSGHLSVLDECPR
jgi:hypothetical protein